MKVSTIFAVFGLTGLGAAQVAPPASLSVVPRPPSASVSTIPPTFLPPPPVASSSRASRRSSSSRNPTTTITTVVSQFVTICAQPTTFYVGTVCYTATSSNQAITVTNCPCTVQSVCTTPYVAPTGTTCPVTGALVTSVAAQGVPPPVVTSAGPVVATATAKATNTAYVTAGSSKPTLMISLMAFFMSLPLLAVFIL